MQSVDTDRKDFVVIGAYFCAVLVTIYSFFKIVLTDDNLIFYGVAKLAHIAGGFPSVMDAVWEVKPIGNRIVWYFLYWFSGGDLFLLKILIVVAVLIISGYFVSQVSKQLGYHVPGGLVFVSMFSVYNLVLLQPEWFAVLGCFLCTGLLIADRINIVDGKYAHFLAGVLMIGIAGLKGTTMFLIPTIFFAAILLTGYIDPKRIRMALLGLGTGIVGALAAIVLWFPHAIPDAITASSIAQHGTVAPLLFESLTSFFTGIIYLIYYYAANPFRTAPIVVAGELCALLVIVVAIFVRGKWDETSDVENLVAMWIFPGIGILLQNEFFSYHYSVLIFPAVVSVLYFIKNMQHWAKGVVLLLALIVMIVPFATMNASWTYDQEAQQAFTNSISHDADVANTIYHANTSGAVLYLDRGSAPFYIGAPSACRYIAPLPLERNIGGDPENETRDCVANYAGKIIIARDFNWNKSKAAPMVNEKLRQYDRVYNGSLWDIYVRNTT